MFSVSKRPTIREIRDLYETSKAIPSQVVQFFLNRSKQIDKKLNSVLEYTEDLADSLGKKQDEILLDYKEKYGAEAFEKLFSDYPLFGIPFSVKGIIQVEGYTFTASSKILKNFKSPYSATSYLKIEKAGGIVIGINNMDEFAMGASGENSAYGPAKNPFDTARIPGGSSSGPIVSVSSGVVVFSLGTDTGGSIRQPAAFCDLVGLKPTYGLVSRYGVMPMASSFDQVGGVTNNVEDNILTPKILAGKYSKDQTSIESSELVEKLTQLLKEKENTRKTTKITKTTKPLRIGIPKEFYIEGIEPAILAAIQDIQKRLEVLGHTLVDVSIPLSKYAVSVYYMTMAVEAAANLERFDGVRYAHQQEKYSELFFEHREKYFGDEPIRRILLGTYISSAGYYDAYYNRAQKVKELARRDFLRVFEEVDVLLTPTTPEFPFKIGEKSSDPLKMYLSDVFTSGINPVRIPGLAVPLGLFEVDTGDMEKVSTFTTEVEIDADGNEVIQKNEEELDQPKTVLLPTGCQLLGPELSEDILYRLAEEIELLVREKHS